MRTSSFDPTAGGHMRASASIYLSIYLSVTCRRTRIQRARSQPRECGSAGARNRPPHRPQRPERSSQHAHRTPCPRGGPRGSRGAGNRARRRTRASGPTRHSRDAPARPITGCRRRTRISFKAAAARAARGGRGCLEVSARERCEPSRASQQRCARPHVRVRAPIAYVRPQGRALLRSTRPFK